MRAATWAVVVGRHGPTAKSRLATTLDADERSSLALAMITDVISAATDAGLGGVAAVIDPPIGSLSNVVAVPDPGGGLARAIDAGLHAALGARAGIVMILPGDVPLVTRRDLRRLADAASERPCSVIVVADRHGIGTNALVLHPPTVIAPAFGPGSAARHLAAAGAAGARAAQLDIPGLSLDIDTPDDLAELQRRSPRGATAAALARLSPAG